MALDAPDYVAGGNDKQQGVTRLFHTAGWIRRRCNELTDEPRSDLLKVYDLAFNCQQFVDEADKWISAGEVSGVLDGLAQRTAEAGRLNSAKTAAEINDDYKSLYAAAVAFVAWCNTNLPGKDQPVPVTVTLRRAIGQQPDLVTTIDRIAALDGEVAKLLAVFA